MRILREHIPDDSIDLVYLDPPFNSKRDYNVIFREEDSKESEAQIGAFEDSWGWGSGETEKTYQDIIKTAPLSIAQTLESFIKFLGHNDVTAYLVMMTPRLSELQRVLKPTGSIYLHCDPTTSHYLKVMMDQIFGKENFRNEIIWTYRRWPAKSRSYQRMHDILLFYVKDFKKLYVFNTLYQPLADITLKIHKGMKQKAVFIEGKRLSKDQEEESIGTPLTDYWYISTIAGHARERLGYPTQKPLELLERIIGVSSNRGDVILDPFCGCGTTLVAAQKLARKWIGIDITHLAVSLMRKRLKDSFPRIQIETLGEPEDLSGARELAKNNKYQFEWWAVDLAGGRPAQDKRKGADKGVDGVIPFIEGKDFIRKAIIQIKGGHINVSQIRDLKGVLERENAAIGVFVTLDEPTKPMKEEAAISGSYHSDTWNKDYPKIQILTIAELLKGKKIDMPPHREPYKNADETQIIQDNLTLF